MGLFSGKKKQAAAPSGRQCPRCGSGDVAVIGGSMQSFGSPLVDDPLGNDAWMNEYQCRDCGYRWSDWE